MRRAGVPWLGLLLAFAASLAAGWLLATHDRDAGHSRRAIARRSSARHAPSRSAAEAAPAVSPLDGRLPGALSEPTHASPAVAPTPPTSTATGAAAGARLAVIIDDCGQWPALERALIGLPIPLTVSIMPAAPYAEEIEEEAARAGQGVMLHLPMEARSAKLLGAGAITTSMDDASIQAQVRQDLQRVPLARGVNNHEGSKATADARVMRDVAQVLAEEGRYFVDSRTTAATLAAKETAAFDVPTASRNVFLDNDPTVRSVAAQIELAARLARERGSAIAIGHPRAATLAALRAEIPLVQRHGVSFALVEELVQRQSVGTDRPPE